MTLCTTEYVAGSGSVELVVGCCERLVAAAVVRGNGYITGPSFFRARGLLREQIELLREANLYRVEHVHSHPFLISRSFKVRYVHRLYR
jgi:hypothetical protein